jgi:hypothetical protein
MRNDLTVVYYSSNRERPEFEAKIMRSLRHASRPLPIISVTQKPMDFGENICVGEREASSHNAWRQLQIGAEAAKTRYVITAESDFIYPKSYFRFVSKKPHIAYLAKPLWVCFRLRGKAKVFVYKPRSSEAAMIVGRDCLIDGIEKVLSGYGKWGSGHANGETFPYLMMILRHSEFILDTPVITFKTDRNMHRSTPCKMKTKCRYLEGIGTPIELIGKYFR